MAPKKNFSSGSGSSGRSKSWKHQQDEGIITFSMAEVKAMTKDFSRRCGEGTHGEVFRGEYTPKNWYYPKDIAVKRITLTQNTQPEYETEALTTLKPCDQIISLIGVSRDSEFYCIVMEYVPKNLEEIIKSEGDNLSWSRTLKILRQLAYGVKAIVVAGYVNGDIKPNNILVDENYNAYICDFGSARRGGQNLATVNKVYTAQEICAHGKGDPEKSDLYSLGVILLELIMKYSQFSGLGMNSSLMQEVMFYMNEASARKDKRAPNSSRNSTPHVSIQARVEIKKGSKYHVVDKKMIESGCTKNDAIKITQLGLHCTEESPNSRPTIDDVIATLDSLQS